MGSLFVLPNGLSEQHTLSYYLIIIGINEQDIIHIIVQTPISFCNFRGQICKRGRAFFFHFAIGLTIGC